MTIPEGLYVKSIEIGDDPALNAIRGKVYAAFAATLGGRKVDIPNEGVMQTLRWMDRQGYERALSLRTFEPNYMGWRAWTLGIDVGPARSLEYLPTPDPLGDPWRVQICVEEEELIPMTAWLAAVAALRETGCRTAPPPPPFALTNPRALETLMSPTKVVGDKCFETARVFLALRAKDPHAV